MKNNRKQQTLLIILLAYFHRYGWIVITLPLMFFTNPYVVMGISAIVFSIWTFLGYILKWKHIYCSYQNANHKPMTPDRVRWDTIKKSDAFVIPAFFFILGVILLLTVALG